MSAANGPSYRTTGSSSLSSLFVVLNPRIWLHRTTGEICLHAARLHRAIAGAVFLKPLKDDDTRHRREELTLIMVIVASLRLLTLG